MIASDTVGTMQWGRTVEAAPAPHEAVGAVITRVEAIPFRLPYARPGRFASGRIDVADNVLVRLHTDPAWSARPRRSRGRTPTAGRRSRSSRASATSSARG